MDYFLKTLCFVLAMVTVLYECCCTVLNMNVHDTRIMLAGNLLYLVDKCRNQGVMNTAYMSVPPRHGKVLALKQDKQTQKCILCCYGERKYWNFISVQYVNICVLTK